MSVDQVPEIGQIMPAETFDSLKDLEKHVKSQIESMGFEVGTAYKETLVAPPDGLGTVVDKTKLDAIVDSARVRLLNWGGSGFPYETDYPHVKRIPFQTGISYVDTQSWPYRERSFYYWQIADDLHFAHINYIEEDQMINADSKELFAGTLGYEWALTDIVRSLVFTRNLLNSQKQAGSLRTLFIWHGLRNRALTVLSNSRARFWSRYACAQDEWKYDTTIRLDSDLLEETRKASLDLFWLFGWQPNLSTINKDLTTLIGGTMLS
jgi:hypothetical protein